MRKVVLVVLVVLMVVALVLPALAIAHPKGVGQGCGCHRAADKMTGSIHTGYAMSKGANGGAAACLKCH